MSYKKTALQLELNILHIISLHYFEYTSDFSFPGESHDFWELVYLDSGRIDLMAEQARFPLPCGHLFFHRPNEFHNVLTDGVTAPNLIVISFVSHHPRLYELAGRPLALNTEEKRCIAEIVAEGRHAFSGPMDDPWQEALIKNPADPHFASEQMIKLNLEMLIIRLLRRYAPPGFQTADSSVPLQAELRSTDFKRIHTYFKANVHRSLKIEDICQELLLSQTALKKIIRSQKGCGVMAYFNDLKIEAARQLIRNGRYNFTEISDQLGFSSIHYFCRRFKELTRMTPSEYRQSVKAIK